MFSSDLNTRKQENRMPRRSVFALTVLAFILSSSIAYGQTPSSIINANASVNQTTSNNTNTAPLPHINARLSREPVVLNFVNAELDSVIQIIAKLTGRNFLLDPKVKGTLNLVSLKPVPPRSVYPLFLASLRQQGLTAIELPGGVTKIVMESDSRAQPVPLLKRGQTASLSRSHLYTYIHPLEYESAAALMTALRPLMTPNSVMSTLPSTNTLIVTDYAENIQKLQQIIETLDRPSGEPRIFRLKHTSATEMAVMLNKLLSESGTISASPGANAAVENLKVNIIPDPRTNSLLIRSENLARKAQIQRWLNELDVPTATPSNLHVIYLRNTEAARTATLLRNVLGLENSSTDNTPSTPLSTNTTGGATNTTNTAPKSSNNSTGNSNGTIAIHADVVNNALLILAPQALFREIEQIVEQMDIRRAQVFVEALVVEMSAEKAAEFGIQWQTFGGINATDSIRAIGGTNFNSRGTGKNILDPTLNIGSIGSGLNFGIVKGTVTLPGIGEVLNLGLLARALESNANANILSTPTLMTLDNEEARIVIGQNVPFITGQYTQTNNATPFQTIERKDVGLTLKVRPQITQGGSVRLTLYQEVSSVQDKTNNAGVITNKRSIESTVLVDDGQVIVLGGLMQDSLGDAVDKVPIAGDLPVIGSFFRYNKRNRSKTNLMIFMRPTIVRTAHKTEALSVDRYRYLIDDAKSLQSAEQMPFPEQLPERNKPFSSSVQAAPQTAPLTPNKTPEYIEAPSSITAKSAKPTSEEYTPLLSFPSSEDTPPAPTPSPVVGPTSLLSPQTPSKTTQLPTITTKETAKETKAPTQTESVAKISVATSPAVEMKTPHVEALSLPVALPVNTPETNTNTRPESQPDTTPSISNVTLPLCRAC